MILVNTNYIAGKELEMLNEARGIATKRMADEAETMGADAIVNIRYATSSIMNGTSEVICYGTAVKFK